MLQCNCLRFRVYSCSALVGISCGKIKNGCQAFIYYLNQKVHSITWKPPRVHFNKLFIVLQEQSNSRDVHFSKNSCKRGCVLTCDPPPCNSLLDPYNTFLYWMGWMSWYNYIPELFMDPEESEDCRHFSHTLSQVRSKSTGN